MSNMSNSFETGSVEGRSAPTKSDKLDTGLEEAAELGDEVPQPQQANDFDLASSAESEDRAEASALAEPEFDQLLDESTDQNIQRSPLIRGLITILLAAMAIGTLAAAVNYAIFLLVNPESLSIFMAQDQLNCNAKLNGQWQTNWGPITFQEQPDSNLVTGSYAYQNLNRGKVEGKLDGQLSGDTLNFDWQETAQRGQKSLAGRGSFLFTNDCQDFAGSYGLEQAQAGLSNWSGQVVEVTPVAQ
jgi:hypothetical protein